MIEAEKKIIEEITKAGDEINREPAPEKEGFFKRVFGKILGFYKLYSENRDSIAEILSRILMLIVEIRLIKSELEKLKTELTAELSEIKKETNYLAKKSNDENNPNNA